MDARSTSSSTSRRSSQTLARWLATGVATISLLGLVVELCWWAASGDPVIGALIGPFSLSEEANVPTWFASSLLLGCAIAAGSIDDRVGSRHWWAITIGLGYASLDEAAELHEHLGGHLDTSGILYFDWVIPAAAIVIVLAAIFLPFIRSLASPLRGRLVAAAVIFVGGALVMELPLGWWTDHVGEDSLGYALIDWFEETLELAGAALALWALVEHRREVA
ncbi:MAG TPA: hypothetical protein VIU61_15150 [Kofleriaceae bacterium]